MAIGLILCLVVGLLATWLGGLQHFLGAPIIGLFLGILISNLAPGGFVKSSQKGAGLSSKYLLKAGIILIGGTMSFKAVVGIGLSALPLIIFNICLSFLVAFLVGKAFGVTGNTRVLVGGGTAICGGTAIATLSPIVEAEEHETAYAMTAIFLFDILAAILWPYAARAMGLDAYQYGILGGLAISDTSSVTAAGVTFNTLMGGAAETVVNGEAITGGDMAVVVKLTRTVMLVFVAIIVMLVKAMKGSRVSAAAAAGEGTAAAGQPSFLRRVIKAFPLFVLGFIVMAILNTWLDFSGVALLGSNLSSLLSKGGKYLIAVALVGVGYKIKLRDLFTKGAKPVLLGGCTWLAVAMSTLAYVLIFC